MIELLKEFFTEGIMGFRFGKTGFFSRPSVIEFNWNLGNASKKDSKQQISGKTETSKFKFDIKIKL